MCLCINLIEFRNKRFARKGALKLLDYVIQDDPKNCRRWVQLPALGTLFAAFMKKGSKRHKKGFDELADDGIFFFANLEISLC